MTIYIVRNQDRISKQAYKTLEEAKDFIKARSETGKVRELLLNCFMVDDVAGGLCNIYEIEKVFVI